MSVETFVITSSKGPREWVGKFGPMHSYDVELEGREGVYEIAQKPETKPPQAGATFTGTIEPPNKPGYPQKLKRAQNPNGGYGKGGGNLSPEAQARIDAVGRVKGRCHAQAQALAYASLQATRGALPDDFKLGDLKPIIDWFVTDAESAR